MSQEISLWTVAAPPHSGFDSPLHMWQAAQRYFEWCDTNLLYKTEQLKKPQQAQVVGQVVIPGQTLEEIPLKRVYTKKGFCIYSGVSENYLRKKRLDIEAMCPADRAKNAAWTDVMQRIDEVIFNQQYEGASAGQFNASIIARGIGLVDRSEVDNNLKSTKEVFEIGGKQFEL